jgi:hypothetical protein
MNSAQINAAFDLALKRARARGLRDVKAIALAMLDDPAMTPVFADPVAGDLLAKASSGLMKTIVETAEAEGWEAEIIAGVEAELAERDAGTTRH